MSGDRRTVRTTQQFFEDLDRQLRPDRGPHGEPSAHDFQVYELLRVVDQFATDFDSMAELIPDRHDYRILVTAGLLVSRFAVIGRRQPGRDPGCSLRESLGPLEPLEPLTILLDDPRKPLLERRVVPAAIDPLHQNRQVRCQSGVN